MRPDPMASRGAGHGLRNTALLLALGAAALVAWGLYARSRDHSALERWATDHALAHVSVVHPVASDGAGTILLPGRLQAFSQAPIHARVDGYLKRWTVDIGGAVKAGQLLGEIDTPDLDQQLLQARADLALARANAELAETTAARWETMLRSNTVARQAVDEKRAEAASRRAQVKSAQAALDGLLARKAFARILAPFDGTVTARHASTGELVSEGSDGEPLFVVSDTRRLRLYVNVPQVYLTQIASGTQAEVSVPDRPGRSWKATIESMSGAVDAGTGASLVQMQIDNSAGELLPGSFASVSLEVPAGTQALAVPASALVFDRGGLRMATLAADDTVRMKTITIVRDLGSTVLVGSGLTTGDRVIENPPDGIADGVKVVAAESGA